MSNALGLKPSMSGLPEKMRLQIVKLDDLKPGLADTIAEMTMAAYRGGFDEGCNAAAIQRAVENKTVAGMC